jgi:endonuclease/exonuclease/phosphatase family metal-dependent hydrolase
VLGGDFNLRAPRWTGFAAVAGNDVDHVFIAGDLAPCAAGEVLDRGRLSDHAPVAVKLRLTAGKPVQGPDV